MMCVRGSSCKLVNGCAACVPDAGPPPPGESPCNLVDCASSRPLCRVVAGKAECYAP